MAHVCLYVCCSDCAVVVVEDSVLFTNGVLKYVACLCKRCDGCFMFIL